MQRRSWQNEQLLTFNETPPDRLLKRLFTKNNSLYLITDRATAGLSHSQIVRQALAAGVRTIQFREKYMSKKDLYNEALSLKALVRKYSGTLIVNDYVDVAKAVDADGVHLGQDDMPIEEARKVLGRRKIIGISTHTLLEAVRAEEAGADYIGYGPVFRTATKDAGSPKGLNALRKIGLNIRVPVVAIGGIGWENVSMVLGAGADACAVVSGILSGEIKANVKKYYEAIRVA